MKNKYILSAALVTLFATIGANAQEGFGTNNPNPSSVIDMVSDKRGVLIPRVKLSATNLATPVTAPANALLVYNELAAGTAPNNVVPGFYYWLTNRWVRITNVDDIIKGSITSTDIVVTDGNDATFKDVQLAIANDAITTNKIAPGAVETSDIKDRAVTPLKLDGTGFTAGYVATVQANGSVTYAAPSATATNITSDKNLTAGDASIIIGGTGTGALLQNANVSVAEGGIITDKLATDAVTNAKLADNAVQTENIAAGAVETSDIKDVAVTAAKINANVAGAGLSQDATGALQIAADGVTAAMINPNVAGSGLTQDASGALQVNTAAIATGDITGGTEVTVGNGTDSAFKDVTLGIANNAITNAKMADNAIGTAEIIDDSVTSADIKDLTITGADLAGNTITSDKLNSGVAALGTVPTVNADGSVTYQPVSTANLANKGSLQNPTGEAVQSITIANGNDALLKNAQISVADGGITTAKIAADAVTNAKLADNAVQTENIAANAVETSDIKDGAVTAIKLAADAADANKVATAHANGTVTYENVSTANLADKKDLTAYTNATTDVVPSIEVASGGTNAVLVATSLKVADGGITTGKLAADAVTNAKLADNAVQTENIAANAVETSDIKDGAVTAAKINADVAGAGLSQDATGALQIAADGVTAAMINPNVAGSGLTQDASGALQVNTAAIATGDITGGTEVTVGNGTDSAFKDVTLGIANNAITNAKMADDAIGTAEIIDDSVTSADIKDATITGTDIALKTITSDKLLAVAADAGKVATANADGTVTYQAISAANLTNGKALTSTDLSVSGNGATALLKDVTIDINTGAVTTAKLADGAVTNVKIGADAVTSAKIADGTIALVDMGTGSVNSTTIVDGSVDTVDLKADAVTSAKILDGTITGTDIALKTVTAGNLNSGAATVGKVATADGSGGVVFGNLPASSVTGADLTAADGAAASLEVVTGGTGATLIASSLRVKDGGISTAKLADGAVTNVKIGADAVTSAKIADGTIVGADVATKTITSDKLLAVAADAGKVATANADGTVTYQAISAANLTNGKALTSTDLSVSGNGATALLKDVTIDINTGAVTNVKIGADAVTSAKIADGTIVGADVATKTITSDKLLAVAADAGKVATANADGTVTYQAISAANLTNGKALTSTDLSVSGNGATALLKDVTIDINTGAVTSAKIADGTIALVDMGTGSVNSTTIVDDSVTSADIKDATITGTDIALKTITSDKLLAVAADAGKVATANADGTVTYQAISAANLTNGKALTSTDLSVSGNGATALLKDVTIDINTGAVTSAKIADGTIALVDMGTGSVNSTTIVDGSVDTVDLKADAVTSAKILDGTITGTDIALKTVTAGNLNSGAATVGKVATADGSGGVVFGNLPASSVTGADLTAADGAAASLEVVTGGTGATLIASSLRVKDGGISTAKLADGAVTNVKIGADAVTSAKIADGTIVGADVATKTITSDKLLAVAADAGKVATANADGTVTYQAISAANLTNGKALTSTDLSVSGNGATALLKDVTIDINTGAVTSAKIADGTIALVDMGTGSVNSTTIVDGSVDTVDLKDKSVTSTKLSSNGTTDTGKVATANADGTVTYQAISAANLTNGKALTSTDLSVSGNGATALLKDVTIDINTGAVTSAKIADGTIALVDMGTGSVNSTTIVDGSVDTVDLKADAVTSAKILDGTITGTDIALKTVTAGNLNSGAATVGKVATADGSGGVVFGNLPASSVTGADLTAADGAAASLEVVTGGTGATLIASSLRVKDGGISTAKLADGAVTNVKIGADAVTSAKIADGTIVGADVATKTITSDKLLAVAADAGKVATANADGTVTYQAISAANLTNGKALTSTDLSVSGNGATALLKDVTIDINTGAVTSAKIADGTIALVDMGTGSVNSTTIVDGSVDSVDLKDKSVTSTKLSSNGTTDTGKVATANADGTVTYQAISAANLTNGKALTSTDLSVSGNGATALLKDVTIDINTGAVTTAKLADGAVTNVKIGADAVTSAKIADGTIVGADVATKTITSDKLLAVAADAGKVATANADGTVTYQAISAANLTNGKALTSTDLSVSGNGATALLKDVTIDINTGAVTTAKLADGAVTNVKIGADAITTDKIAANAVETSDIKDRNVTAAKLDATGSTPGYVATVGAGGVVSYAAPSADAVNINNAKTLSAGDTSITIGGTGIGALLKDANVSVATGGITSAKINADVAGVGLVKNASTGKLDIADGGVTTVKLADNSVNSTKIIDGTIVAADMATPGNDKILTSGGTGTVTWVDKSTLAVEPWQVQGGTTQASGNGQNIYQAGNVGIGLASTDVPNTTDKLDVKGGNVRVRNLPATAGAAKDKVVVADSQGVLKTVNAAMSKVFYMPSVVFDTSLNGTFTKNLYQEYVNQFTGTGNPTLISSPGAAAIPYYQSAAELDYHVLYYDTAVFSNISISAAGVLTYTIVGPGTEASFMNILFVVK